MLLPWGVVPLLVCAVVGYDLRQRYAKRLGLSLCVRGEVREGDLKFILLAPRQTGDIEYDL